jgi:hypothetical protein
LIPVFTSEQAVQNLADRVDFPAGTAAQRREALEASLLPMVRCVLRTGRGNPRLVRWVQAALPAVASPQRPGPAVDPDQAAAPVARLLCRALLAQVRSRPDGPALAAETVVEL